MSVGKYLKYLNESYKKSRGTFILYTVLRIMVIITMIRCIMTGNYENALICVLSLILFLIPAILADTLKISIPPFFQGVIFVFIFAAEILGEVDKYYVNIPGWDTILHTINGFLFAAVGFSLFYLLNRASKNVYLSPFYLALVAFCFSMTIGVVWEFFEFTMDQLFYLDMQKDFVVTGFGSVSLDPENAQNVIKVLDIVKTEIQTAAGETFTIENGYLDIGIIDSMKDLLVNCLGAIIFCIIGYISVKTSKSNKVTEKLMITPSDVDPYVVQQKGPRPSKEERQANKANAKQAKQSNAQQARPSNAKANTKGKKRKKRRNA